MSCRKCNASATIFIRKEYWYCNTCFLTNTNHKFRACLGKSKTLSPNENVLICLSGGANSMVLLDLVQSGITLNGTKKLRVVPFFLHIIETATTEDTTRNVNLIIEQCKKYNFLLYIVNINEYYSTNNILSEPNIIPQANSDTLNNMRLKVSATIFNDVILKIKRHLFLRIANELGCKIIFTAETTTQLAKRLLSNLSIGRGSQVENDTGFSDDRDKTIKIIRPMKDISSEEIDYFVKVKQLNPVDDSNKILGLQSVIDNFVLNLQENYPATVSTVCKTADKIGSMENTKNCTICQSNITLGNALQSAKLTAVEATIFSRQMCFKKTGANDKFQDMLSINEDKNPMFPSIYETLCYGCSRNFSELDT